MSGSFILNKATFTEMTRYMKSNIAKLLLRLSFGGIMLTHGIPKLMRFFNGNEISFADPIGIGEVPSLILAVFSEVVCSILIVIGFKTKWATIPAIITMLVAVFVVHIKDPFGKMEMGLLYLSGYLVIFFLGCKLSRKSAI